MSKRVLFSGLVVALMLVSIAAPAWATKPDPEHKVSLCHRTASDTNPYVFIEVDEASLDAHLNNLPGHPGKEWKTDGTFRGVAHLAGDIKFDYEAKSADECEDFEVPDEGAAGFLTPPTCDFQNVVGTVENKDDEAITAHIYVNGELKDSFGIEANETATSAAVPVVDGDEVELFIGDNEEAEDSLTVSLDCESEPTVSPTGIDETHTKRPPKVLAFTGANGPMIVLLVLAMLTFLAAGVYLLRKKA